MFAPDPKKYKKSDKIDPKYRAWIKKQPCCNPTCLGNCGDIVPAHMSILGEAGTGTKAPDKHALPLGVVCHNASHAMGDITFWGQGTKTETKIFVKGLCDFHYDRYKGEQCQQYTEST